MSIYLGKIVALFALPLGWVLLAGVVALGLLAAKRRRPTMPWWVLNPWMSSTFCRMPPPWTA